MKGSAEVHGEHPLQLVLVVVEQGLAHVDRRCGNDGVEPVQGSPGRVEGRFHRRRFTNVHGDGAGFRAQAAGHVPGPGQVDVEHGDPGAEARGQQGHGLSDARAGAYDRNGLAVQAKRLSIALGRQVQQGQGEDPCRVHEVVDPAPLVRLVSQLEDSRAVGDAMLDPGETATCFWS